MDRDGNHERTELAYQAMIGQGGREVRDLQEAISLIETDGDEFYKPIRISGHRMTPADSLLFFNFRPDRMKQIYEKFVTPPSLIKSENIVSLMQYPFSQTPHLIETRPVEETLGAVVERAGIPQVRVAETE